MADDNLINTSADELEQQNKQSESTMRIKQLSEKVRLTAEEGLEKDRLLAEQGTKIATLEKENAFSSGFTDVLGNYPSAKDHKDAIKEKVMAGYSVEDAAYAVLGKAGKLGGSMPAPQVAGGSADTAMSSGPSKDPKDMSQADRRAALDKELAWQ